MKIIKQILSYYPEIYLVIIGTILIMLNQYLISTIFNGIVMLIILIRIFFGIKNFKL